MATSRANSFKAWLLDQQDRQDSIGTFARMAAADSRFPDEATDVRQQLRRSNASEQTMAECAQAIAKYNQLHASKSD